MGFLMDMLDLEKLLESADMVDKISKDVTDAEGYNAVTKSINESVSSNTDTDLGKVISIGNKINDKLDLDLLESQINGTLGLAESKLDPIGKEDADVNNDGKVDDSDAYIKNKRDTITTEIEKENVMENATKIADIPANVGKPATGIDDAKKFQQAVAVKQSEYVNANTEHQVAKTADETVVDTHADKAMGAMRGGADSEKDAGLDDGGQNVPTDIIPKSKAVTESGDITLDTGEVEGDAADNVGNGVDEDDKPESKMRKGAASAITASEVGKPNSDWKKGALAFTTFVESLRNEDNTNEMNAVLEAFELISSKK